MTRKARFLTASLPISFMPGDYGTLGGMDGGLTQSDGAVAYLTQPFTCAIVDRMLHRRSWKEFKGVAARRIPEAIRSSINPSGEITFDLDTFKKMGEPQAMYLLYDPSTRTIGLKAAHPDETNAVLVRIRHARSNRVVRSQAFLRENGIAIDRTLRFPFPFLEDDILILDLRTAVTCGKGGWKKIKRL